MAKGMVRGMARGAAGSQATAGAARAGGVGSRQRAKRQADLPVDRTEREAGCQPETTGGGTLAERTRRLAVERKALGCTQAEIAHLMGISTSSLSRRLRAIESAAASAHPDTSLDAAEAAEIVQRAELALRLYAASLKPAQSSARAPAAETLTGKAKARRGPAATSSSAATRPRIAPAPERERTIYARPPLPTLGLLDDWAPVPAAGGANVPAPARCRILIAEDDADTVGLYRMVFADDDEGMIYDVDVARTASECLDRLRAAASSPYDLLLMDLGIGDMHGSDTERGLLDRLKRMPALLPSRVLVVSGISPYQLERKAPDLRRLRARFLSKPFDIDELLACVRSLLDGRSLPPPALRSFDEPAHP